MDIINGLFRMYEKYDDISVALGTFDGVHLGHQKIIERVVETAAINNGTSVVFTFDPHPRAVLRPNIPLPLITTYAEKQEIMAALGVKVFCALPFHREFANLSPEEFVRDILVEYVRPGLVVVGPNYTFGKHGKGTPELLKKLGEQFGFAVKIEEPVFIEGHMVSSSLIRKLINKGEISKANELLYRPFTLAGEVVRGDGRGRGLGFPTANIAFSSASVIPADGVYAVRVSVGTENYFGVANVGANPTFQGEQRRLEVHILDFGADIYGQFITVEFAKHLRGERTFAYVGDLTKQIAHDTALARNILAGYA